MRFPGGYIVDMETYFNKQFVAIYAVVKIILNFGPYKFTEKKALRKRNILT